MRSGGTSLLARPQALYEPTQPTRASSAGPQGCERSQCESPCSPATEPLFGSAPTAGGPRLRTRRKGEGTSEARMRCSTRREPAPVSASVGSDNAFCQRSHRRGRAREDEHACGAVRCGCCERHKGGRRPDTHSTTTHTARSPNPASGHCQEASAPLPLERPLTCPGPTTHSNKRGL